MKVMKRLLTLLATACLTLSMTLPVMAATPYTYTVRIYAGAHGTINGGDVYEVTGIKAGSVVTFDMSQLVLEENSKYQPSGIKLSGKDNSDAQAFPSIVVDGDADYVVTYKMASTRATYHAVYLTEDGTELGRDTFTGNLGEVQTVAAKYFEGYSPRDAYNVRGTLTADGMEYPVYYKADPGVRYNTVIVNGVETIVYTTEAGTTTGNADGTGTDANAGTDAGTDGTTDGNAGTENDGPQEVIDIDEQEAPLANNPGGTNKVPGTTDFATYVGNLPSAAKFGIISGLVLIVGTAAWLLLIRKKKS